MACAFSRLLTQHNQEFAQMSPYPFSSLGGRGLVTRLLALVKMYQHVQFHRICITVIELRSFKRNKNYNIAFLHISHTIYIIVCLFFTSVSLDFK